MDTTIGGYTCAGCGLWVQNGVSHRCWNTTPIQPAIQSSPGELRIAAALERIAAALEALREAS